MISLSAALELVLLTASLCVFCAGAAAAWTSVNIAKRLVGILIAQSGACLAALALGAPQVAAVGLLAVGLGNLLLGAAIAVRLQESYHSIEAEEIDAADRHSEPAD